MENTYKLISGFIILLIGIVLITQIATTEQGKTQLTAVSGETHATTRTANGNVTETVAYTVTNAPTGWKTTDCPITGFTIKNASGTTLTLTTDYTVTDSTGVFYLKNTTATNAASGFFNGADNYTYVSYKYCGDDYLDSSWGRSVLDMVPGFFAIALLLTGVGLCYSAMKDAGIM